jgi:flagellar protein FliO/FliZ
MTPDRLIGSRRVNLSAIVALLLLPTPCFAQAGTPSAAPVTAAAAGPSLLPMLLVLAFVLALIPASIWLLKRLGAGSPASAAGMKVVAQLPLGPRERLVVVEAGDRWLLLGVTASSINRVGTLARGALPAGENPGGGFAQLLNAARHGHGK